VRAFTPQAEVLGARVAVLARHPFRPVVNLFVAVVILAVAQLDGPLEHRPVVRLAVRVVWDAIPILVGVAGIANAVVVGVKLVLIVLPGAVVPRLRYTVPVLVGMVTVRELVHVALGIWEAFIVRPVAVVVE
jgi:hypothetical protein